MRRIIVIVSLLSCCIAVQSAHASTIKVTATVGQNTIGFLQLTGAQDRYIIGSASSADSFSINASASSPYSFVDASAPPSHDEFAGLISPGVELQTSNSNAGILGEAPVTTAAGSTPQSGGSVSIPGSEYETTIWSLSGISGNLTMTPQWVNHDGSTPADSVIWDPVGETLYLTANPAAVILNHPGALSVTLTFLGSIPAAPEPSSLVLLGLSGFGLLARRRFAGSV